MEEHFHHLKEFSCIPSPSCPCSVAKLCPTPCGPMDCSPPGSSVHGISQARVLEWVAISFSRCSSWHRDRTHVSCIGRRILHHQATRPASPPITQYVFSRYRLELPFLDCYIHEIIKYVLSDWSDVFCSKQYFELKSCWYGEGNGNPLQYSCLENPTDGGAR